MSGFSPFYVGLAFILMHEMDAIRCRECRIFPGLSALGDRVGFVVFLWAHLVLYTLLFIFLVDPHYQHRVIFGISIFFIVHLILHMVFLKHPKNEFKDLHSWLLITGAALFGAWQLVI
ncbi:MAG: hypothetical protein KF846_07780 [Cyclobacteriaceae bacterium]|nr:hypothetical protein [Cyclobacteriaceae bacterium]